MKQAMPDWRAFSSDATPGQPDRSVPGRSDEDDRAADQGVRARTPLLVAGLLAAGGVLLGVALTGLVALLLLSPAPAAPTLAGLPLEGGLAPFEVELPIDADVGSELVVDVAGAVERPGLHRLSPGARVGDAIAAAGGYGPRVDLATASEQLNLAQPLEDGAKVLVPELGRGGTVGAGPVDDGRIDLNRAGQTELETLPGIGPVTARKIVDARTEERFASVRELRTRGVVGQAVFDDIRELVRVAR